VTADTIVTSPAKKVDYRPAVKRLLDHHFEAMGIRPTVREFADIQSSIVHLLDTGSQHPDITAADERIKKDLEDRANAGKPR